MAVREGSYRQYACLGCGVRVTICGLCDHGNVYCASECAQSARRASLHRAGARYQRTRAGAHKHAARQRAWRQRHQGTELQIVTHHGYASSQAAFTVARVEHASAEVP